MKKVLIFLILIMLSTFVYAECQYKDNESYQILEMGLYDSQDNYVGVPLNFSFVGGYQNIAGCNPPSMKIYNNNKFDVTINLKYVVAQNTPLGGIAEYPYVTEIVVNSFSNSEVKGNCYDIGGSNIPLDKISYVVNSPELLVLKNKQITKQREICKICPNGKQCLDDNQPCNWADNKSKECGSEICNIAKYCSKEFVVQCPAGYLNCNNETCLLPSTKKEGEGFKCDFECESKRGQNGICIISLEKEIFWNNIRKISYGLLIVFGLILIGYFVIWKKVWPLIEKGNKAKEELPYLEKEIGKLKSEIDKAKQEKNKLEDEAKEAKIKINKLKEEIKNSSEKSKKILEEKLKIEQEKQKERFELITEKNKEMQNEEERLKIKEIELGKKEIELERHGYSTTIKEYASEYKRDYETPSLEVYYDENEGYFLIRNRKTKQVINSLHKYIYLNRIDNNIGNKEVHHIDYNALNNKLWNLIALPKEKHNKEYANHFDHSYLEKGNWEIGIHELKRQLGMKNEDFHEYIKNHFEEQRKQKRLGAYTKRPFRRRRE